MWVLIVIVGVVLVLCYRHGHTKERRHRELETLRMKVTEFLNDSEEIEKFLQDSEYRPWIKVRDRAKLVTGTECSSQVEVLHTLVAFQRMLIEESMRLKGSWAGDQTLDTALPDLSVECRDYLEECNSTVIWGETYNRTVAVFCLRGEILRLRSMVDLQQRTQHERMRVIPDGRALDVSAEAEERSGGSLPVGDTSSDCEGTAPHGARTSDGNVGWATLAAGFGGAMGALAAMEGPALGGPLGAIDDEMIGELETDGAVVSAMEQSSVESSSVDMDSGGSDYMDVSDHNWD